MNTPQRRLLSLASSLVILISLAACATGEKKLDVEAATRKIDMELASRFDIRTGGLDCPDEVIVEDGAAFECTGADQRGRDFSLAVELIGTDGRFSFSKPDLKRPG